MLKDHYCPGSEWCTDGFPLPTAHCPVHSFLLYGHNARNILSPRHFQMCVYLLLAPEVTVQRSLLLSTPIFNLLVPLFFPVHLLSLQVYRHERKLSCGAGVPFL